MEVLRELAIQGKTIITSIHQPSSQIFQSFDQLILLADGKTIFMVNKKTKSFYFFKYLNNLIYRVNHRMHFHTLQQWVIIRHHNTIQLIM